jgi:hypothetical protein
MEEGWEEREPMMYMTNLFLHGGCNGTINGREIGDGW